MIRPPFSLFTLETCQINFTNPDRLYYFEVIITPSELTLMIQVQLSLVISGEGYWKGGKFTFEVQVPEEYNNKVCYLDSVLS